MTAFLNKTGRCSLALAVLLCAFSTPIFSQETEHESAAERMEEKAVERAEAFNPGEVILHHVMDDHVWHLWDGHYGTIHLPIIIYDNGFKSFSSSNFYDKNHNLVPYNGYELHHNHIINEETGKAVFDISITKNVAMLLINAVLLVLIFLAVAKAYKKNTGRAPKGIQSFFEPIILFVRDEVVKPNIGHHYEKFLPYILTLFFFILFGNLLGLLPGAGNLTGNIAVTLTLAVLTFIITNVNGSKSYWSHIFWTPGVPLPLRIVILPVEIIGMFTKPISLTIRLFVAITAGHIVLLALICLTFIFGSVFVGIGSSIIVLFISLIEILVAGIQAYVFALFTSLYIGMAIAEDEHH